MTDGRVQIGLERRGKKRVMAVACCEAGIADPAVAKEAMKILAGLLDRISSEYIADYPDSVWAIAVKNTVRDSNWADTICPIHACLFPRGRSHYLFLMNIDNRDERRFSKSGSRKNNWFLSELKRQFNAGTCECLALRRDKDRVRDPAWKGHILKKPWDLLKNLVVLEFLGLIAG